MLASLTNSGLRETLTTFPKTAIIAWAKKECEGKIILDNDVRNCSGMRDIGYEPPRPEEESIKAHATWPEAFIPFARRETTSR